MKKLMTLLMLPLVVLLTNCKKDPEPENTVTTVSEDKQDIKQSLDGVVGCMNDFRTGDFLTTTVDFFGLSNGNVTDEDYVAELFDSLFSEADFQYLETEERFILANHYGSYTYDKSKGYWTRVADQADKAIFKFPSTQSSSTNDMELIIGSYSDSKVNMDGEQMSLPKTGSIALLKSGVKIAYVELSNFSWEAVPGNLSIPTNIDLTVMMSPVTYKFSYNRVSPTQFTAKLSSFSSGMCGYEITAKVDLLNDDYENLELDENVDRFQCTFKHKRFVINHTSDISGMMALSNDPTVAQINSKMTTTVDYMSQRIGILEFYNKTNGEVGVQIRYKDNTTEDVEQAYMDQFFSDMELVFSDMTGDIQ